MFVPSRWVDKHLMLFCGTCKKASFTSMVHNWDLCSPMASAASRRIWSDAVDTENKSCLVGSSHLYSLATTRDLLCQTPSLITSVGGCCNRKNWHQLRSKTMIHSNLKNCPNTNETLSLGMRAWNETLSPFCPHHWRWAVQVGVTPTWVPMPSSVQQRSYKSQTKIRVASRILSKPIYMGMSILDYSKIHMYSFYYDVLKPKYQDNIKLVYTILILIVM